MVRTGLRVSCTILLASSLSLAAHAEQMQHLHHSRKMLGFWNDVGNAFSNVGQTVSDQANKVFSSAKQGVVEVASQTINQLSPTPPSPNVFVFPPANAPMAEMMPPAPAATPGVALPPFLDSPSGMPGLHFQVDRPFAAPAPAPLPLGMAAPAPAPSGMASLGVQPVSRFIDGPMQSLSLRDPAAVVAGR